MSNNIEGQILIATPKLNTDTFRQTVIYVHTDDTAGAIGVILNVPMDYDIASKWSEEIGWPYPERIHMGGPVDRHLGYVLHTADYARETSIVLNDSIAYTGGKYIVSDINRGVGPNQYLLVTGYCSWQPGQLKKEVKAGMWTVVDFESDFLFQELDREAYWEFAIHLAAQHKTDKLLDTVDSL